MYNITLRPSGYILTFEGAVTLSEMQQWYNDSVKQLKNVPSEDFGVIVDMSLLKPIDQKTQELMIKGQQLYKEAGMKRSAVILQNPILKLQFSRLAKESGIYDTERYFDGAKKGAVEKAIKWVKEGVYEEDTVVVA